MKKAYAFIAIASLLASAGCKPTEANYRQAYEQALEGRNVNADEAVTGKLSGMSTSSIEKDGQSIATRHEFAIITKDGGGTSESLKKYCVVAAQFKQAFNARSMRERLAENGYPSAFVAENGKKEYFVIAGAFESVDAAFDFVEKLKKDAAVTLLSPAPYILIPAGR